MTWRANCTVDVLRGETVDTWGDPTEADTTVYTARPAALVEQGPNSRSRPVDGRDDQVRGYTLRVFPDVVLHKGDRIRIASLTPRLARTDPLLKVGDVLTGDFHATIPNTPGHDAPRYTLRKVT